MKCGVIWKVGSNRALYPNTEKITGSRLGLLVIPIALTVVGNFDIASTTLEYFSSALKVCIRA